MHQEFLMGNQAIALGALAAGVRLVAGYPGTPSTEVLETVAKNRQENTYVEWSVNEKSAMEVGAGAAYTGARTMVTMKQVGLNVAADPLMSLEYIGVKGGMVILVADDPGPISSQTEQDTRHFARFSKLPCFDPSTVQEAYDMVQEAFEYSEKYGTPVFFRSTTRVSHGYASIQVKEVEEYKNVEPEGFVKDTKRWVIFPKLSYQAHINIEARNEELAKVFSQYKRNLLLPAGDDCKELKKGIATGGFNYTYVTEAMANLGQLRELKVSTPHPFPEQLAVEFLTGLEEVLCIEELDPVIERELIYIAGKYHLPVKILGKLSHHVKNSGENTRDSVLADIAAFMGRQLPEQGENGQAVPAPELPVRPPVLCAGCPHRASFYAVKKAMQGRKTIFCGDIGCYTMGNAMPLDMVDTCLCMGAGLGIAQGVGHIEPDTSCFAFVGDSTFFAAAIPGVVNAVYNQAEMTLVVLDNSTTAMTGHQPHPGTGHTMMGEVVAKVNIEAVLQGIGVTAVETVNPLDLDKSIEVVRKMAGMPGVKAIIFKYPCIAITKPEGKMAVDIDKCVGCRKCIREIGCPGLIIRDGQVAIDESLCTGCGLCSQICPFEAIGGC
ncbi:indolepyruvate ferredoxin oxidoreductase subunit alpha [Anaerovibrio lipolyticus]|uniref:indolepyruvate ferredoxin oxidoreductase subunit alpha n=1 Tax=Anaerovibrio lipolyticus TaxID=82374 RepID=UPI001F28817C|nr:indolepyruvate ferredoxin oxidoreductase subunit alpha [Anaerovibrio lipolyticus]MCF2601562.1 indolepyruvate ferredoxin oxidoreductase subunit alpha [Anaerovibrio lipolyticus]